MAVTRGIRHLFAADKAAARPSVRIYALRCLVRIFGRLDQFLRCLPVGHHFVLRVARFAGILLIHLFCLPIAMLTGKELVSAELAFQLSVEERFALFVLQAEQREQFGRRSKHPRLATAKAMFEQRTDIPIELLQILVLYPYAVGRIEYHQCIFRRSSHGGNILLVECNLTLETGTRHVGSGNTDRLKVAVASANGLPNRLHSAIRLGAHLMPEREIEVLPVHKVKILPQPACRCVGCNHRSFDQKGSAAAHRIQQRHRAIVSRFEQNSGGKHFVQRSFVIGGAITAMV